jgi:GT2 family glycosyltransferase
MLDKISISIVSHLQIALAKSLILDLQRICAANLCEIILTINVPEELCINDIKGPVSVKVIRNKRPRGFGANHNAAFDVAKGNHFVVLNPDVRLTENPFPSLVALAHQTKVGVVAPKVVGATGLPEDSARCFPSPLELMRKVCGGSSATIDACGLSTPDWVAGMFMLFPSEIFHEVGGFDERYFLYYEDVDLCARLALAGYKRLVCSDVTVVHDARRSSHGNLRYASIHLKSILRFFSSHVYRQVRKL